MQNETIVIIDFGGQYNQLIARRVREANVYCEVVPYSKTVDEIKALNPKGIIFTGGPNSVFDDDAPKVDSQVFELGIPILGICYGAQLMSMSLGGVVHHLCILARPLRPVRNHNLPPACQRSAVLFPAPILVNSV